MNKLLKYTALALLATGLASCQDWLDMPSETKADSSTIFESLDKAQMATLACYENAANREIWYQCGAGNDEIYSSESNTNSKWQVGNFVYTTTNCPTSIYKGSYASIENCNTCIKGLESMNLTGEEDRIRNMLLGEALALRAHYYLLLIRYFGDVPYHNIPTIDKAEFVSSRTSRDIIYDDIIADLQRAVTLLPWYSEGMIPTPERISKNAAYGLLARVALYAAGYSLRWDLTTYDPATLLVSKRPDADRVRELYQIASDACQAVISKGENTLVQGSDDQSGFEKVFRAINEGTYNPSETMWEFASYGKTTNGYVGYTNGMFVHNSHETYGKSQPGQYVHPTLYLSYDPEDTRRDVTVANYGINADGSDLPATLGSMAQGKWRCPWKKGPRQSTSQTDVNWPLLRYSDVLLMYAEAQNELNNGPTPAAKSAFEEVRLRAFNNDNTKIGTTPTDKESFLEAIIQERAWELASEGWRRTDLIRWNLLGEVTAATKENLTKLCRREAPYDQVKTWRAYKETKSTKWKDPVVALEYVDFENEPTADDLAKLSEERGGSWKYINLFAANKISNSAITGLKENEAAGNVGIPIWISGLFQGYEKNKVELFTLNQSAIIDANPGLRGQQHPAY